MRPILRIAVALAPAFLSAASDALAQRTVVIAPPGTSGTRPRISGDGATVAFGYALRLVDIDGSNLRAVPGVSIAYDMALSGDGRRLVYDSFDFWGTPAVFLLDTRSLSVTRLSGASDSYLPTISDDGSVVAWDTYAGWGVVNADGSNPRLIGSTLAPAIAWGSSLTADGSVLVMDASDQTQSFFDIWRAGTSGAGLTRVTGTPEQEIAPRVSDDGTKVLYGTHPNLMAVIAANADGSGAIDVSAGTPGSAYFGEGYESHDLSGDGRIAAFTRGGPIVAARTDGSWRRQIGKGFELAISGAGDVVVTNNNAGLIAIGVPDVVPDEIHRLAFAPDGETISWQGRPSANVYNVYRGGIASLRAETPAACLAANLVAAQTSDPSTPVLGEALYYLVTGENGAGEGTSGRKSGGAPRSVTGSCPPADADADGTPDASDTCPLVANAGQADADGDGSGDACDNCPAGSNPEQFDFNGDGTGEGAPPLAQVSSPNGGETLTVGQIATLTWTSSDDCVASRSVTIQLSRDGPGGPFETIAANVPDTGSFTWNVTGPAVQGPRVYLSVTVNDGWLATTDLSDGGFRIR